MSQARTRNPREYDRRKPCLKPHVAITHLHFEGKQIFFVVSPADSLRARGHLATGVFYPIPIAHHPSFAYHHGVSIPPGLVEVPTAEATQQRINFQTYNKRD